MSDLISDLIFVLIFVLARFQRERWGRQRWCNGQRPRAGHFQLPLLNEP